MKQVVQPLDGDSVRVTEVPRPLAGPADVLVQTISTLVSPGTEKAVTELASAGLVAKARARPDLVRQVIQKARRDGLRTTLNSVRSRLASDLPLGYSGAGVAVEVGEHVPGIRPGDLVATGGAGRANHAEFQSVPGLLCTKLPEGVTAETGSFATVASIALHAIRLGGVETGSKVVVVGLGLIGQLACRLAAAAGCDVAGIDLDEHAVKVAIEGGAVGLLERGGSTTEEVLAWSRGRGADLVLVAASGRGSQVIARSPDLCRDRASIVVLGDVGLELDRRPFYDKELSLRVARSYGPGRYERSYEEWGVDMPAGYVRWTEGRNQEAVLDLIAADRLSVEDLVTHRFPIADAPDAYRLIQERREPFVAIQLTYPATADAPQPVVLRTPAKSGSDEPGVGLIGTGAFASTVLLPAFRKAGFKRFVAAGSSSGLSAKRVAERFGFERVESGGQPIVAAEDVDTIVIATAHDSHATLAASALRAGKAVWCEKPLALSETELADVEEAWRTGSQPLFVGFNRRWAPAIVALKQHFATVQSPLVVNYRINAGLLPPDHWYSDRRQGGRVLGEVCHFVDACEAIAGPIGDLAAFAARADEALLVNDIVVAIRHETGSLSTITYASGGPSGLAKERIEVLGGGHSALLDDFRSLQLDGTTAWTGSDKGHGEMAAAFRTAVQQHQHVEFGLSATAAVLRVAGASLITLPKP